MTVLPETEERRTPDGSDCRGRSQGRAFLSCFLRTYLVGATFNPRGYQSTGMLFAMYPGLKCIHPDPDKFRAACKRYVRHFQTHPFWAPCLVGIFLSWEMLVARGQLPPAVLSRLKNTTSYTLSAIGDSVFAGSLLIFWALSSICLLLAGLRTAPFLLGAGFFLAVQIFRACTFWAGLRQGMGFLNTLKRWDLINWGRRVKYLNAGLLILLWVLAWPGPVLWTDWVYASLGMLAFTKVILRRNVPREVVIVGFIVVMAGLPWLLRLVSAAIRGLTGW